MLKFKEEQGLTLVELLVVIALVAIVAAIALPILTNVLSSASVKADAASQADIAQFSSDWTAAGYTVNALGNGGFEAVDASGAQIATIGGATGGNGGGQYSVVYAAGTDYSEAYTVAETMTGTPYLTINPGGTAPAWASSLVGKTVKLTYSDGRTFTTPLISASIWGTPVVGIPMDGSADPYLVPGNQQPIAITSISVQ